MRWRGGFHFRYVTNINILLTLRVYFTNLLVINLFEHLRIFLVELGNSSEFLGLSKWDSKKNLVFAEVNKNLPELAGGKPLAL